ncbi:hypothetical protein [Clostridium sp. C8]|jgi:hypothetical protein|uniref:hypothetical protein n=1 Tax=Clostridium sp. C8 TaxID=1667357 RepID=UPI00062E79CC|nr:hypothetical protein [Clostridium sp. C8]KLE15319.1 hypothetical protein AAT22_12460 [Clostridium sp. C8]MDU1566148.1 hypothetical protein [Clostridium sp.]
MLIVNTDASSKKEKPNILIGYVIYKDDVVMSKDVREIDITKEIEAKKINETIYIELLSVNFVLEELLNNQIYDEAEINIYNNNTSVIYILNRLFRHKRKTTKIEEILKVELENAKNMISRIGTVKFKYISSKDNKAHNTLEIIEKHVKYIRNLC